MLQWQLVQHFTSYSLIPSSMSTLPLDLHLPVYKICHGLFESFSVNERNRYGAAV